jgi:hypothetical protein
LSIATNVLTDVSIATNVLTDVSIATKVLIDVSMTARWSEPIAITKKPRGSLSDSDRGGRAVPAAGARQG